MLVEQERKLKKAIDVFGINLSDKICFDIGASTGGFTDCMLREGAFKVLLLMLGMDNLITNLEQTREL